MKETPKTMPKELSMTGMVRRRGLIQKFIDKALFDIVLLVGKAISRYQIQCLEVEYPCVQF